MVFCNNIEFNCFTNYNCHNPYFNRWFSAILILITLLTVIVGHNPYFNRWFSAILTKAERQELNNIVTILILIDGFLQCDTIICIYDTDGLSQSLF